MTDNNQPESDPATRVSRRNLLLAATGATAVGVPGVVGASRDGLDAAGATVVAADESYRRLSSDVTRAVRREHPDAGIRFRSQGTADGLERFAAGEVDAYLADRPMLPAERDRADANGVAHEGRELAVGGFALVHPETPWYDCVSDARLVEAWTDGGAATYAEVAGTENTAGTERVVGAESTAGTDTRRRRPAAGNDPILPSPDEDASVLVRGTRAFQYERGFGGSGYYEPAARNVRRVADLDGDAEYAPLVRLAFLHLDRESLHPSVGAAVERACADRVARTTGEVTYFADPSGVAP